MWARYYSAEAPPVQWQAAPARGRRTATDQAARGSRWVRMAGTAATQTVSSASLPFVRALLEVVAYEEVAQAAVDAVPRELPPGVGVISALLCTVDADAQRLRAFALTRGPTRDIVEAALDGRPLRSFTGDVHGTNNLLQRAVAAGTIQTADRLLEFLVGAVDEPAAAAIEHAIGWQGGIAVPLPVHQRLVGVLLYALRKPAGELTVTQRRRLVELADIIGLALEQARLYEAERRRSRETAALQQVLRRLSTAVDASKVLEEILDAATALLGADYAAVTTVPTRPGEVAYGLHRGYRNGPREIERLRKPGTGLVDHAMRIKGPVLIERFGEDDTFPMERYPVQAAEGMRSGLAVPLIRPFGQTDAATQTQADEETGEAFGALLVGYRQFHPFLAADVGIATALAQHAATALERAWLFAFERQRAAELEATFQTVGEGIALFDGSAQPVRVNREFERLTGLGAEDYRRLSPRERTVLLNLKDIEGRPLDVADLPAVRAVQGEHVRMTMQLTRPSGDTMQYEVVASPLRDRGDARRAGAAMVIRDIGIELRRQRELEALVATSRQLSAAIDQENVVRAIVVAATEIVNARGAVLAVIDTDGGDGEEPVEPRLVYTEWYHDHTWQAVDAAGLLPGPLAQQALATGDIQVVAASAGIPAPSPEVSAQAYEAGGVLALPVCSRGETLAVVVLSGRRDGRAFDDGDVRLLRAFAQQAATALENARLYERERLARQEIQDTQEQREAFIAAIAHDLKSPLTNILGHGQLLERHLKKEAATGQSVEHALERAHPAMQRIADNARRMQGMVDDLQEALRLGSGRFELHRETSDLVQLAQQVSHEQQTVTERHTLTVVAAPRSVSGLWDPERLRQVLLNLVSNAIKYSPDGGPVEISVRKRRDMASLTVTDQGIGLLPEDMPVLFQPYSRLHRARGIKGTGLGLFIVKGIVEAHGGKVRAYSAGTGLGTTFRITLPLQPPVSAEQPPRL